MAKNNPSDIGTILLAIQQQLRTDEVFTNVEISLTPYLNTMPPDDQFCLLTPGEYDLDKGSAVGGGKIYGIFYKGHMTVTIWQRLESDVAWRDQNWLTNLALGALTKVNAVLSSLSVWTAYDIDHNALTGEPLFPAKIKTGEKTSIPGWGYIQIFFEMNYWQDTAMSQNEVLVSGDEFVSVGDSVMGWE